ncbi:MAG: penicillin acylase family protein [Lewinellaceae bacterium]|nr:penicillin acylase family protein [Lewinellaceae bacterium]
MRVLRFLLALSATLFLLWFLTSTHSVKGKNLPPLGSFFNPFSGFWQNAEPKNGLTFQDVNIPGLAAPVKVVYDDLMVPHIFAENRLDAARVQGYITAQYRLFQMDLTVRKASGRLSEVIGDRTMKVDLDSRRKGLAFAAENDLKGWAKYPETMALFAAYTEGVNAWLDKMTPADYPIEYKLLNFSPEPWTILKCALITEAMAETLCAREEDLAATNSLRHFGIDTFNYLYPEWNSKQDPIIPDTGQWKSMPLLKAPPAFDLSGSIGMIHDNTNQPFERPEMDPYQLGSNNWALAGSKTKSGKPMLANDPHLMLTLPSIWYQVQIHTPNYNCYGVSIPGSPGIVIGFNENVAWGVTNVSHDVSDYYKIDWTDDSRMQYKLDNEVKDVELRVETIKVKGQKDIIDTVKYTAFGPVRYGNDPENPLFDYALRWTALDVPEFSNLEVFMKLNAAKGYADYKAAIYGYDAPAQNFVFASNAGDIAIQVQGKFPLRGQEQGRFLQDGSSWANAWQDHVPWEQVPSMKNPSRGFVFSANQHSTPPSYPYYYLGNFEDFRGRRIYNRLTNTSAVTLDSMKSFQLDNFSQRAADALPAMLHLLDRNALNQEEKSMVDLLATWNFQYDGGQLAATLFDSWVDSCYALTWDEIDHLMAAKTPALYPDGWRWIEMLQTDTSSVFFDIVETPVKETARDIVLEGFKRMEAYFSEHPESKKIWSESRPFTIKHLAGIEAFSRLDLKPGGHKSAPNAVNRTHGPSWRMIVDLAGETKAVGVFPGGQSGNPGSKWYDNMVESWANGEYYDLLFLKSADQQSDRVMGQQTISPAK